MRSVVVLPAPFGPRKPVTRPSRILNVNPSTAVALRKRFRRSVTSITQRTLRGQPLHESVNATRLGDVHDLELAGDDGAVAEQPAEEALLDLDGADP
jgi:hypothetical protein